MFSKQHVQGSCEATHSSNTFKGTYGQNYTLGEYHCDGDTENIDFGLLGWASVYQRIMRLIYLATQDSTNGVF